MASAGMISLGRNLWILRNVFWAGSFWQRPSQLSKVLCEVFWDHQCGRWVTSNSEAAAYRRLGSGFCMADWRTSSASPGVAG
jgi:hypothetical protein